ncbi:secretion protein HlyD (plasmid) [Scytonema sp. HK-05]|uniref:HlyD family secretion protein n=1 Tax=Scytonema sp. HK-05 TaxID=1137095 RepID=UPI0009377575|nr:HlyD family secretion protein [Scytonema sp. HK-05]OKH59410.1 secretion protein HlyD [Scytonema sp. HK-05]BAY50078.1 secretion protein HlyD [Scytonema sp. HK-05]
MQSPKSSPTPAVTAVTQQNGRVEPSSNPIQVEQAVVIPEHPPADSSRLPPPKQSFHLPVRKLILIGSLGLGIVAGAIYGYHWWQYAQIHQETDDAYITADIHPVNARIAGTVVQVAVDDNQVVKSGTVLVKLDPRDYQVNLEQAQAALAVAKEQSNVAQANIHVTSTNAAGQTTQAQGNIDAASASIATAQAALSEAQAGVPASQSQLAAVEANLVKAKLDYDRYNKLSKEGAVPRNQFDAAKATYDALVAQRNAAQEQVRQAQARVAQAQENLRNAKAKLASTRGTLQQANATKQQTEVNQRQYKAAIAAIDQAKSQVDNAQLQLSYTTIMAPTAGIVGNKTVQAGQRVQPGQTLMSVVSQKPWIVANFKETQLGRMKSGQQVEIKIDAFPNRLFKGTVNSLSPASGAKFALLPPDNATGNFTKIVQRLPVKVVFDSDSIRGYESQIAPGMSVIVNVETR